jgi:hypothetical protein
MLLPSSLTLQRVTFFNNSAQHGGGVFWQYHQHGVQALPCEGCVDAGGNAGHMLATNAMNMSLGWLPSSPVTNGLLIRRQALGGGNGDRGGADMVSSSGSKLLEGWWGISVTMIDVYGQVKHHCLACTVPYLSCLCPLQVDSTQNGVTCFAMYDRAADTSANDVLLSDGFATVLRVRVLC